MKTIVEIIAVFGLIAALGAAASIVTGGETIFGGKFTLEYVMSGALISIAASGLWFIFNEKEKNKK